MTFFKTLAAIILTSCASPALALDCVDSKELYDGLTKGGFQPVFVGDTENATLVIWVHKVDGWVSIIDTQDGASCLVGQGQDWQFRALGDDV